jgi:hypothetical protein
LEQEEEKGNSSQGSPEHGAARAVMAIERGEQWLMEFGGKVYGARSSGTWGKNEGG